MNLVSRILMSLFALAFLVTPVSHAADTDKVTAKGQAEIQAPGDGPVAEQKPAKKIEGIITFIEPDGSLIIRNPAGESNIVYIRNKSRIVKGTQEISREDLKVGDTIDARVDSMRKAERVEVVKKTP